VSPIHVDLKGRGEYSVRKVICKRGAVGIVKYSMEGKRRLIIFGNEIGENLLIWLRIKIGMGTENSMRGFGKGFSEKKERGGSCPREGSAAQRWRKDEPREREEQANRAFHY